MDKMLQQIVKHFGVCEIEERGNWVALNTDYINNNYDIKTEGRVLRCIRMRKLNL